MPSPLRFMKIPGEYWKALGPAFESLSLDLSSVEAAVASGTGGGSSDPGLAAAPNGTDDTDTIRDAVTNRKRLRAGTYTWRGTTGIDTPAPFLVGVPGQGTTILIPDGQYLIDSDQLWESTWLEDVFFYGGAGAVRNRFTGSNVSGLHVVRGCRFQDFTATAISHNASDMPYWMIDKSVFWARNETASMGIALSGLTDSSSIIGCAFYNYRVAVKLRAGFANIRIRDCDFVHYDAAGAESRACIWLVPKGTDWQGNVNAGNGTLIEGNKFGPENLGLNDSRILLADEGAGALNGVRLPSTAVSSGYVNGVRAAANLVGGMTENPPPLIRSYTPHFISSQIVDNQIAGTMPTYLLTYEAGVTPDEKPEVTIGPITRQWAGAPLGTGGQSVKAVNRAPSEFWIITRNTTDPNELLPDYGETGSGGASPGATVGFPPEPVSANPAPVTTVQVAGDVAALPAPVASGTMLALGDSPDLNRYVSGAGKPVKNTDSGVFFGNGVISSAPQRAGSASQTVTRVVTNAPWLCLTGYSAPSGQFDGRVFLRVNGVPVWSQPRTFTGNYDGHESGVYLEFADATTKLVEITTGWMQNRLAVPTGSTLTPPPVDPSRHRLYIIGDSWTDGTAQGGPWRSWARYLQSVSGWDIAVQGLGGTGYVAGNPANAWTSPFGVAARVNAAIESTPDVLLIVGSINDGGQTGVQAAAESIITQVASGSAATKIAIIGPQIKSAEQAANMDALKAAAAGKANVIGVLDPVAAGWDVPGVRGTPGAPTLNDPAHPTPAGAEWWGRRVEEWVRTVTAGAGDPTW